MDSKSSAESEQQVLSQLATKIDSKSSASFSADLQEALFEYTATANKPKHLENVSERILVHTGATKNSTLESL